jgi:spore germination protein YaaH
MGVRRGGAAAAAAVCAACALGAGSAHGQPRSIHKHELALHAAEPAPPRVMPRELPTPRSQSLARAVYGYYPFWVADLTTIRWEALTHLAWFSVDLDATGAVVARHGWPDEEVVTVAHAADVRVDVTFTLFGASAIEALCLSPARRATAIDNMVSELEAGGADGVSVDFEFVNVDTREAFVTFITELRAALDARGHADAQISIAGPAVNWGDAVDLDALLDHADWFFVMGYGYFWSGSSHAGPTGMLRVTDAWEPYQSYSMLRTIAEYTRTISPEKRRQILWGVPYYGREWVTADGEPGASALDQLGAVTYTQAQADLAAGGVELMWDDGVKNAWYRWQSAGAWHQVYFDDAEGLAAKYALALAQDLGGVGMWALNYDAPHAELWDLLEATFAAPPEPVVGDRQAPIVIDALPFHDARDTAEGASHYFNYYSCDPDTPEYGREWVYRLDVCQPGTVSAAVPEYPDRDPDLHLLAAAREDACVARAHTELEADVAPGRYLLVVDTYVDVPVEREGAYELDVDFVPAPGSEGCAAHLVCDAGACVCGEPGQVDCDGRCSDTAVDDDNCGACGVACSDGERCAMGRCEAVEGDPPAGSGGAGGAPPAAAGDPTAAVGCSCRLGGSGRGRSGAVLMALALALAAGCRRRSALGVTAPRPRAGPAPRRTRRRTAPSR